MDRLIDLPTLLERFAGDKDILQEVVKLFIDECPKLMEDVRIAVARKDPAALDRTAHTLKGSVSNFSPSTAALARKLELMGRTGNPAGAEQAYAALEDEIAELVPALAALFPEKVKA